MPKTYDLFGNPEDETPELPVNDNQAQATAASSIADRARQSILNRQGGGDLPPGYSADDLNPAGQGRAFLRSVGGATSPSEGIGNTIRMGKAAARTIGGYAVSTGKLMGGLVQGEALAPVNAIRLMFRHAPIANPMLDGSLHDMVQGQVDQFARAGQEWDKGNHLSAIGHGAAGALPLFGPFAANVGEKLFTTQTSEALGELAGAALIPKITKSLVGADYAGKLNGAREVMAETGAKIANSTLPKRVEFFRRGANPGRVMAPLGATSIKQVPELVRAKVIEPTYNRLQSVLQSPAARTHAIGVADSINEGFAKEIGKAENRVDTAKIARLEQVRDHHISLAMDSTSGEGMAEPAVAVAIKQGLGDAVDWTVAGDSVEGSINQALMNSYRIIDSAVDRAIPATKALNQRLADGLTAINAAKVAIAQDAMGSGIMKHMTGLYSVPAAALAAAFEHPGLAMTILGSSAMRSFTGRSMLAKGLSALGPGERPMSPIEPTLQLSGIPASEPSAMRGLAQDQPVFAAGNNDIGQPGGMQGSAAIPMNPQAASMAPGYFGMTPEQISLITDRAGGQSYAQQPQIGSPAAPQFGSGHPAVPLAADGSTASYPATPPIPREALMQAVELLRAGRISYQDFMQWMAQTRANYPQAPAP